MSEHVQVATSTDSRANAERIARTLVEAQLAACVQVLGPIASTYRWQGKIETAEEWLCLAKTRAELYARVEEAIRAVHPYELPEILAIPIAAGSQSYLDWMDQQTEHQA